MEGKVNSCSLKLNRLIKILCTKKLYRLNKAESYIKWSDFFQWSCYKTQVEHRFDYLYKSSKMPNALLFQLFRFEALVCLFDFYVTES